MNTLVISAIRNELREKLQERYEIELFTHLKNDVAEIYLKTLNEKLPEYEFRIYDSYAGCLIVALNK